MNIFFSVTHIARDLIFFINFKFIFMIKKTKKMNFLPLLGPDIWSAIDEKKHKISFTVKVKRSLYP